MKGFCFNCRDICYPIKVKFDDKEYLVCNVCGNRYYKDGFSPVSKVIITILASLITLSLCKTLFLLFDVNLNTFINIILTLLGIFFSGYLVYKVKTI